MYEISIWIADHIATCCLLWDLIGSLSQMMNQFSGLGEKRRRVSWGQFLINKYVISWFIVPMNYRYIVS